jgi:hypothetical protein
VVNGVECRIGPSGTSNGGEKEFKREIQVNHLTFKAMLLIITYRVDSIF